MPKTDAELRDHFAAAALTALLSGNQVPSVADLELAVRHALDAADEMVRQRAERSVA